MTSPLAGANQPPLSQTAIWAMVAYLVVLIVLGLIGRFARRELSMGEFFLGARSLGFIVLFLIGFVVPNQIPHRLCNVHDGLWGLAFNGITIVILSQARSKRVSFTS